MTSEPLDLARLAEQEYRKKTGLSLGLADDSARTEFGEQLFAIQQRLGSKLEDAIRNGADIISIRLSMEPIPDAREAYINEIINSHIAKREAARTKEYDSLALQAENALREVTGYEITYACLEHRTCFGAGLSGMISATPTVPFAKALENAALAVAVKLAGDEPDNLIQLYNDCISDALTDLALEQEE